MAYSTIEQGGIVTKGPDAERVWRCGRLFVAVLLRADPCVRNAYGQWQARNERDAADTKRLAIDLTDPGLILWSLSAHG